MLDSIISSFPVFSSSQVLTSSHLNSVRDFLDGNTRFDRKELTGVGIICGLGYTLDKSLPTNYKLTITKGMGLTGEGYVVSHEETIYNKAMDYIDPSAYPDWSGLPAGDILELVPETSGAGTPLHQLDLSDKVIVAFIEALDTEIESCLAVDDAFGGIRRDLVLKMLLVKKSVLNSLSNQLDNLALVRRNDLATVKLASLNKKVKILFSEPLYILHSKTDVVNAYTSLINESKVKAGTALQNFYNAYGKFLGLKLEKISYAISGIDNAGGAGTHKFKVGPFNLTDILVVGKTITVSASSGTNNGTYTISALNYVGGMTEITVSEAINSSSTPYGTLEYAISFNDLVASAVINRNLVAGNEDVLQYVEAYLEDLVDTYNEAKDIAWTLRKECMTDLSKYDRHLLIGDLNAETGKTTDPYRSHFIQASLVSEKDVLIVKAQLLFKRMALMVQSFRIPTGGTLPVIVTPSVNPIDTLSERPLPYYYDISSNSNQFVDLLNCWDGDLAIHNKNQDVYSYHLNSGNSVTKPTGVTIPDYIANPYDYFNEEAEFVRIEGHIGKLLSDVIGDGKPLSTLPREQNVYFNVAAVKLENVTTPPVPPANYDFGKFSHFAYKYPGLEHRGGVPAGGTFVLVYDDTNTIVADFCLKLDVIQ